MAKLRAVLICEKAIIEQGGMLSLITLVDEVSIGTKPPPPDKGNLMLPHKFTVVQFWERSNPDKPENVKSRSQLLTPDGKVFGESLNVIDLTKVSEARIVTVAPGFPWRGEGDYSVTVQLPKGKGWRTVSRAKFRVKVTAAGGA